MSGVYYADYLKLDKLLSAQVPLARKNEATVHEETLFIITHQVYELWFKQILHELDSVRSLFSESGLRDQDISKVVARLHRVVEIQRLSVDQIKVLETMTPMEFLEFRDALVPASGFQSVQFRLIENKLGLKRRTEYGGAAYSSRLKPEHQALVSASETEPNLISLVDDWLARTPFLKSEEFAFWKEYRKAVEGILSREEAEIRQLPPASQSSQMKRLESTRANFAALFDRTAHEKLVAEGKRRFSFEAMKAALLILLYRDEPVFQMPFRMLHNLADIDEWMSTWRVRHSEMVFRMIGNKMGTGGSSGHDYLRKTAEDHRIFFDIGNLSTFLISQSDLPELPEAFARSLGFHYQG